MHHKETEHYSEIKTAALEKSEVFEQQSKSDGNKNYTVFYRVNLNCFFLEFKLNLTQVCENGAPKENIMEMSITSGMKK